MREILFRGQRVDAKEWVVINNYLLRDVQLIEINDIKKGK